MSPLLGFNLRKIVAYKTSKSLAYMIHRLLTLGLGSKLDAYAIAML